MKKAMFFIHSQQENRAFKGADEQRLLSINSNKLRHLGRSRLLIILAAAIVCGCARVRVEGSKEPIKVDISMRLDIYQHVQKDIDSIENIVAGDKNKPQKEPGKQGFLDYVQQYAYAQEELNPEIEQAALRRKDRHDTLLSWEAKAVVGENKLGLVEIRNNSAADGSVEALVKQENADRMIIYRGLADKYSETVEQIQKVYADKLTKQAPAGTPIEVLNESTGAYEWIIK